MVAPSKPLVGDKGGDKAVMGALRSKKESKKNIVYGSPTIIMQTFMNQGMSKDKAENAFKFISQKVKANTAKIVQLRNTAFIIYPRPDMSAEFFITSLEPENLAERIKSLSKTLKEMGFRKMYTLSVNPQSEQLAQQTGLPIKRVQSQIMSGTKMIPAFRYEVQL